MAYKAVVVAAMVGLALGAPQYDYTTPEAPPALYVVPSTTPTTTTTTTPSTTTTTPTGKPPQMVGMPYDFKWDVDDQESYNAFSHVENSDGRTTQGEYRVLLPDGRTQVVTFHDNGEGFTADVTYE